MDSIDQLINSDYDLQWMFYELPKNVKIILSTLIKHGGILNNLKSKLNEEKNFLEIEELNATNVKTILEDWLMKANKSLTEAQWSILDEIFKGAKLHPLYVKLCFDIIIKWDSFYEPDNAFKNNKKIDDCIRYLFNILEKEHGSVLFSRCIFYMSSFKNGISESELEDILSLDDQLLSNVFVYHSPPIRRFPMALWARIKHTLNEYIVEKEIDNTPVICW